MKRILCSFLGCILLPTAHAASFDCSKASSRIEKMICDDEKLSQLDEDLSAAYRSALQNESQSDVIRRAQKRWLSERNRCQDDACIDHSYQSRISALQAESNSSEANQKDHKPLSCPQCGVWNVNQADIVVTGSSNAMLWEEPIGETIWADAKSITIPGCGSYLYRTTSSKVRKDGDANYHDVSMQLTKKLGAQYSSQCESNRWALNIEFDDSALDDGGWGGAYFVLDDSSGKQLRLQTWNAERRDLSKFGENGEGELASFNLDHSTKELKAVLSQVSNKYKKFITAPFDLDQFHDNAIEYCEKQYEDTPGNPAISARELECEVNIYKAKISELKSWKCDGYKSVGSKGISCKFPVDSIDESKDYTSNN